MASRPKTTTGSVVGNRSFFPERLAEGSAGAILRHLANAGPARFLAPFILLPSDRGDKVRRPSPRRNETRHCRYRSAPSSYRTNEKPAKLRAIAREKSSRADSRRRRALPARAATPRSADSARPQAATARESRFHIPPGLHLSMSVPLPRISRGGRHPRPVRH